MPRTTQRDVAKGSRRHMELMFPGHESCYGKPMKFLQPPTIRIAVAIRLFCLLQSISTWQFQASRMTPSRMRLYRAGFLPPPTNIIRMHEPTRNQLERNLVDNDRYQAYSYIIFRGNRRIGKIIRRGVNAVKKCSLSCNAILYTCLISRISWSAISFALNWAYYILKSILVSSIQWTFYPFLISYCHQKLKRVLASKLHRLWALKGIY